jgi:hypothetical protein
MSSFPFSKQNPHLSEIPFSLGIIPKSFTQQLIISLCGDPSFRQKLPKKNLIIYLVLNPFQFIKWGREIFHTLQQKHYTLHKSALGLLENRIFLKNRKSSLEPKTLGRIARSSTPSLELRRSGEDSPSKREKRKQWIRRQMRIKKLTCEKKLAWRDG